MAPNAIPQTVNILLPGAAAEYVGLSTSMMAKLRCLGGGPAYHKLGRAVRYRQDDLDNWLATRRVRNTSEATRLSPSLSYPRPDPAS